MLNFQNRFFFTFLISSIFHTLIFFFLFQKKQVVEINRYKIINLASFKEYESPSLKEVKKKFEKIENKKENKKNNIKLPKKKVNKTKQEKSISVKKTEQEKLNKFKEEEPKEIKSLNIPQNQLVKPEKNITPSNTISNEDKKIQNKELEKYFILIVEEMTFLAKKSYPRRSRILEEEGKILIEVKINSDGLILSTKIKTKKPKRLANAAESLLKRRKEFPSPPQFLFKKKKVFSFEIPINFILK